MAKKMQAVKDEWEDMIAEPDVIKKLHTTKEKLRRMRKDGVIKHFRYASPGTTGNPDRPGKKPIYSMSELIQLFSATA